MMSAVSDAPTTTPAPRAGLRAWLRDLGAVVAQGARLWARSWPLLLVIALLAVAGRHAAGWAAVNASTVNNTLGWAVLVLAPLSMVAGIVAMLHVLRRDLPALAAIGRTRGPDDAASGHERGLIDVLASVFVPFLALYASYGLLERGPVDRFLNTAAYREFIGRTASPDRESGPDGCVRRPRHRAGAWSPWSWWRSCSAGCSAGGRAAATGARSRSPVPTSRPSGCWPWRRSRPSCSTRPGRGSRAGEPCRSCWTGGSRCSTRSVRSPAPVDAVVDAVAGVLGNLDDLVVIPLAWLTVGAVVYGHKLAAPPRREPRLRPAAPGSGCPRRCVAGPPRPPRPSSATCAGRFTALTDGLRRLAVAGLGPMLVFALAFLAATRIEEAILMLGRASADRRTSTRGSRSRPWCRPSRPPSA